MIKLDRLKAQLHTSGLQNKDQPLYQVIISLIDAIREVVLTITGGSGGSSGIVPSVSGLTSRTYLTKDNETATLPNSVQLVAGSNISFDDTVANQRTINVTGGSEWSVATNGDLVYPELIFAGGDVIMLHTP